MLLIDVNVLVYAFREDISEHVRYAAWVQSLINGDEAFGVPETVLSGFMRIVTHPRIFSPPSPPERALRFAEQIHNSPGYTRVAPGRRHWGIFTGLCRETGAVGNLISDAYLAALAIELGCEWVSTDHHYARFRGLKWRHPLG